MGEKIFTLKRERKKKGGRERKEEGELGFFFNENLKLKEK